MESARLEMGEELRQLGVAVAVVLGTGSKASESLGGLNHVVCSLDGTGVLAFSPLHRGYIPAVTLKPSAQEPRVYGKLARLTLGSTSRG